MEENIFNEINKLFKNTIKTYKNNYEDYHF